MVQKYFVAVPLRFYDIEVDTDFPVNHGYSDV